MIRNFFKVAVRNMLRHKGFSFINIAGLTLGLTACLLIGLFVWDEHQYDKNIPEGDQVYRLYTTYTNSVETGERAVTPPRFATAALIAWKLTVIKAMPSASVAAIANTHQPIFTR